MRNIPVAAMRIGQIEMKTDSPGKLPPTMKGNPTYQHMKKTITRV